MPVAYLVPPPAHCKDEFDALDLSRSQQMLVECPRGCGATYALIYDPMESDERALRHYGVTIRLRLKGCDEHPDKIVINY